jgi:DNA invertase Pin-like site-specific DNA recombinase
MKTNDTATLTHPLITAAHLRRKAIIYVRQSSREMAGSIAAQINQAEFARAYGWPEHLIEVIDEDLGKCGSSLEHRNGWQRMLDQIANNKVGAVFAANISRLSRQLIAYEQLRSLVSRHGTLLCIANYVSDPR